MCRVSAVSQHGACLTTYYNDNDPYVAEWLSNLVAAGMIPRGYVDGRNIEEVGSDELGSFRQCHFFAGIGGWAYALSLAGWSCDRPVWTGSCPCQGLSSAARGRTPAADLWPAWLRLIAANRPRTIFGEQIAQKGAWLDQVCDDLGALGYQVGAAVLPAVVVGADHARSRIYFVGHTDGDVKPILSLDDEMGGLPWHRGFAGRVESANGLSGRMAIMRAYGNAIVPQIAAAFIRSFMDCMN